MRTPFRLPKWKIDKLTLPELPDKMYYCFYKYGAVGHPQVYVRRKRGGVFFKGVAEEYAWSDHSPAYQEAVTKAAGAAKLWAKKNREKEW